MDDRQFIRAFEEELQKTRTMMERSIDQVGDDVLHAQINPQQNSVAVIMQHVAGNLRSRFTDFLSSDGEKPWRDRESEFVEQNYPRPKLMELWEQGWTCLFQATAPLQDRDLGKVVSIRNEPHTVLKALLRASTHLSWHASQVALIAKHFKGDQWRYLTIPPKAAGSK